MSVLESNVLPSEKIFFSIFPHFCAHFSNLTNHSNIQFDCSLFHLLRLFFVHFLFIGWNGGSSNNDGK